MATRITELVNTILREETDCWGLSEQELLGLIDLGDSMGGASGRHWVLDPIDGTRGFVGLRQYAVCLGLLVDGKVRTKLCQPLLLARFPHLHDCAMKNLY